MIDQCRSVRSGKQPWSALCRALLTPLLAGVVLVGASVPGRADMVLSDVIVAFAPGEVRKEIVVTNTGEETLFVSADLAEIIDAGSPDEERVVNTDPELAGMIVSPTRIVVQPGQRKTLRIAYIGDMPAEDRVYRLLVKPAVGDIDAQETMLRVLIGYDVLVVVQPEEPAFNLDWNREGSVFTVTNTGNTNALLYEGRLCPGSGDCVEVQGRRIYPGLSVSIDLPAEDGTLTYMVQGAGQISQAEF